MRYNPGIFAISMLIVFQSITVTMFAKDPPVTAERFRIPLHFIQNAGQWDAEVRYGVIRGMEKAAFTNEGIVLWRPLRRSTVLPTLEVTANTAPIPGDGLLARLDLRFVNPSKDMYIEGLGERYEATQIYRGNDSSMWRTNIPSFTGIRYANVWPGVDIEYSENGDRFQQCIVLHPGANPADIRFEGADVILDDMITGIREDGDIYVERSNATMGSGIRYRPYRNFYDRRREIATEFNTFFGGNGVDEIVGFDIDQRGYIHLYMQTASSDLPVLAAHQANLSGDYDMFHACLKADAQTIHFATYIGGSLNELRGLLSGGTRLSKSMMSCDNDNNAHMMCNAQSLDFPITANALQPVRPAQPSWHWSRTSQWQHFSVPVLLKLDSAGLLISSTWLGGPGALMAAELTVDAQGNTILLAETDGVQWCVTPGTIQDTIDTIPIYDPHGRRWWPRSAILVKINNMHDSVVAGTYIFDGEGEFLALSHLRVILATDRASNIILCIEDHGEYPLKPLPRIRNWLVGEAHNATFLCKISGDLTSFIYATPISYVDLPVIAVGADGSVVLVGMSNSATLVRPLETENTANIIMRYPPTGGEPAFVTYNPIPLSFAPQVRITPCNEILVFGRTRTTNYPFVNPLDTVNQYESEYLLVLDYDGTEIRHSGYWHPDEKYIKRGHVKWGAYHNYSHIDAGNNLTVFSELKSIHKDSVTMFSAIQPLYGNDAEGFLFRTRVPGCELLSCGLNVADTVFKYNDPALIHPRYLDVSTELLNIDPAIDAGGIECQISLPKGLVLDPDTQRARIALGDLRLRPGDRHTVRWRVRVDDAAFDTSGAWIDVVTYYFDADRMRGTPSVITCDAYINFARRDRFVPEVPCAVTAPDSLLVLGDNYDPTPFPVSLTVNNTGSGPITFARFSMNFGDGMYLFPVPAGGKYAPGATVPPGGSHTVNWQARALRRPVARDVRIFCIGEDPVGNPLSLCDATVHVPAMPVQCMAFGTQNITINPESGAITPNPAEVLLELRSVIDSALLDINVWLDLSACRHLSLPAADYGRGPLRMIQNDVDTLRWQLGLASNPVGTATDTLYFRITGGGGRWSTFCMLPVRITMLLGGAECALYGPPSVPESLVIQRTPVAIDYSLRNTGTVALDARRVDLSILGDAGLLALDPLSRTLSSLSPGDSLAEQWKLRMLALRASRNVTLEAFTWGTKRDGTGDSLLAICTHDMYIPGIDGLLCDIITLDTVRFLRDPLGYDPDPVPVTLDLRNILDTPETSLEAEIDLTNAPRFEPANGETAMKTLASIDSNSAAQLRWLLHPLADTLTEAQHITVRYRSTEQGDWKDCSAEIIIESWPQVQTTHCVVSGHDSLHADAAYEILIPEPFEISYTATNTGTVALHNCSATIMLPPEFELVSDSATLSFGELRPGDGNTRWWTLKTTSALAGYGAFQVNFTWRSDEQGSITDCDHTVHVLPDAPTGIVFTPLHLHFEAEQNDPLPAAQYIQLWTGGGLSMPWTAQGGQWWLNADPVSGDHAARIAVQPNSTALPFGLHATALTIGGQAPNLPRDVAVTYRIKGLVGVETGTSPTTYGLGPVWPQPVPLNGEARISVNVPVGEYVRIVLYDALGREVVLLRDGMMQEADGVLLIVPSALRLQPGMYFIRMIGAGGQAVRAVVVR
ncbi:MAG: T9SS type A sorting domain-containing protein [Bacteroidia bacterium]|nr:T9SS type A sorting domain-containing protein [Bacteroidia bacterium]